ncbi:hypothetical protein COM49_29965 [Bacillus pseudomycoides]|nr:hypothetical protein CON70_22100 [Bacillus pseudomycoides]PEE04059.1 hypothetical protein CON86_21990 [Bacillus pseudomycoides]PEM70413.1 hypothetical protein CN632_24725 [Bacillus pseudomycoides]PEO84605.1 hypothetical protein CN571_22760 [Bacillus pseudomycoides]PEP49941.1 hypothetical protein CN564_25080 [Bacillus pseudomycoides]
MNKTYYRQSTYIHQDTYMRIKTMEFYVEIGLLQDERLVANELEENRAFALINVIKLLDVTSTERIESILRGNFK